MKTALITGIRGQDAAYLAKLLLKKNYRVIGGDRRSGGSIKWRLKHLGIEKDIEYITMDLTDQNNVFRVIENILPDNIYNLAAQSYVAASFDIPYETSNVNAIGTLNILDTLLTINPGCKFYQASTSEMFGKIQETPQSETTPFYPRSPYGVSKLYAHWMTVNYREAYDMFNCCGILFNHESPLRGEEFVTQKIASYVKANITDYPLELGNLDAARDWGHAEDYVEAMYLMMQQNEPDDYVIATGETHTVREFVEAAFNCINTKITWEGLGKNEVGIDNNGVKRVIINSMFYRPAEVQTLLGNPTKAKTKLNWKPKYTFKNLVENMIL